MSRSAAARPTTGTKVPTLRSMRVHAFGGVGELRSSETLAELELISLRVLGEVLRPLTLLIEFIEAPGNELPSTRVCCVGVVWRLGTSNWVIK